MSNVSYEFKPNEKSVSTGKLLYISKSTFGSDWKSFSHRHFCTEIFCIESGTGDFKVDDSVFLVKKNDIIIVNSNLPHSEYSSKDDPLSYYVIGIEDINFLFENPNNKYPVLHSKDLYEKCKVLIESIIEEMKLKKSNHENICNSLSDILVLNILRQKEIQVSTSITENISRESFLAKEYIDKNFHTEISLDLLAEHCLLSKFYLSRKFTQEIGVSPIEYLTDKRLQVSENLLAYTNLSILQIADLVGYSSQSYFAQIYKKRKNMSPSSYRSKYNLL